MALVGEGILFNSHLHSKAMHRFKAKNNGVMAVMAVSAMSFFCHHWKTEGGDYSFFPRTTS